MRAWGGDPDVGPTLIDGLASRYRVIAADYEGHRMANPAPDTLTPDALAADVLAIADAAGAGTFAWYGYSWLALTGLQVALRTDRLWALAMGGYPPLDGPYAAMLDVTRAAHALSVAAAANAARRDGRAGRGHARRLGLGAGQDERGPDRAVRDDVRGARHVRRPGRARGRSRSRGWRSPATGTRSSTDRRGATPSSGSASRWRPTRRRSRRPGGPSACSPGSTT